MLTISPEQFGALEGAYRVRRRAGILAAVRAMPARTAAGLDDATVLERIDAAIADGKDVGITKDQDVVRLAALAFLPEPQRSDPTVGRLLTHLLRCEELPPAARLTVAERLVDGTLTGDPF